MCVEHLGVGPSLKERPAVISLKRFGDERGWFSEIWSEKRWAEMGYDRPFVQDNHAYSAAPGVLRGLHFQSPPHAQAKLVRCSAGRIFDVIVDIRRGSPEFGRWIGVELSAEIGNQLYAPRGFLHAYMTLTPDCEVQYKVDDSYAPEAEGAVRWNDADLGIVWPLSQAGVDQPTLSAKDAAAPLWRDFETPFVYGDPV